MSDDYEDLLAEMAKLGRLEIQPSVVIWSDEDEVDLMYDLGSVGLNVTVRPDRTLGVRLNGGGVTVAGWDRVADHLHTLGSSTWEQYDEPLEVLRRHLESQVWLLRLLLEMK